MVKGGLFCLMIFFIGYSFPIWAQSVQSKNIKSQTLQEVIPKLEIPSFAKVNPVDTKISPRGNHFHYTIQIDNKSVYGSQIIIHEYNNESYNILGYKYEAQTVIPIDWQINELSNTAGSPDFGPTSIVDSIYFPTNTGLQPAWKVKYLPENIEVIYDRNTGNRLNIRDCKAYYSNIFAIDTPARGLVYLPDPLTKNRVIYGGAFQDNNDQDSPVLDQSRDTVALSITYQTDTFYLRGPYVQLEDIEAPWDLPVRKVSTDFYYQRSEQGFEDVNAYYHIHKFQTYLQSLGFTSLFNAPVRVDPHGLSGNDNSYWSPLSNTDGYMALGEGGVDDAEDADVIVHEYGHALCWAASPDSWFGTERRGMEEGICDFFAVIQSQQYDTFHCKQVYNWDGHNPFWAGREAYNQSVYPITTGNIYETGNLWSAILLDLQAEIGNTVITRIQLEALYHHIQQMTLPQAGMELLKADSLLYGGAHSWSLRNRFCARQVFTGEVCVFTGDLDVPAVTNPFLIWPQPAEDVLHWEINSGFSYCEIYSLAGQKLFSGSGGQITLGTLPAGVYAGVWSGVNGEIYRRLILIN